MPAKKSPMRMFAAACIVAAGACLVAAILVFGIDARSATSRDFIQYWALEQQLAHHGNPYDAAAILRLEQAAGLHEKKAIIDIGPPVAFFYALPLGWLEVRAALIAWTVLLLACLGLSVWLLWLVHGRPESRWHVIVFAFPPALWCLVAGQLGIFFLLDVALFLYFIKTRPFWAGASLVLCALKPHLFLPCIVVLALWSFGRRRFAVLWGLGAALAVSCGLTLWVDPRVWAQYAAMMRSSAIMGQFIPTVSTGLRFLIDRQAKWIEFVPEAAACLWAAWYFWVRRERWDWRDQGLLVLLVAAAATPYSWYTDQAMLFPAILMGLYAAERSRAAFILFVLIAGAGMVGFVLEIPLTSAYYLWTAPAWLLWYWYAMRSTSAAQAAPNAMAAGS